MKTLKHILTIIAMITIFASCTPTTDINEENQTEYIATGDDDEAANDDDKD